MKPKKPARSKAEQIVDIARKMTFDELDELAVVLIANEQRLGEHLRVILNTAAQDLAAGQRATKQGRAALED